MIQLKTHAYLPKMREIQSKGEDEADYICFSFDINMGDLNAKKVYNVSLIAYLFLDHYEGVTNLTFNILQAEDSTDSYYFIKKHYIKPPKSKTKKFILQKHDKIAVKEYPHQTVINHDNLDSLLVSYIEEDIIPTLYSIVPFLNQYNITYNEKELSDFFKEVISGAHQELTMENLMIDNPDMIQSINSFLLYDYLHEDLTLNNITVKRHKI